MARYQAQATNPPQVWDSHLNKALATFITFGQAVSRAYCLNAFSTGIHADVIPFPANTEVGQ